MTMRMAMYKGPADGLLHQVGHLAVCIRTASRYSHCELVFGPADSLGFATCWSSSSRDGGVRPKRIDLTSGRWDIFALPGRDAFDEEYALNWFHEHRGAEYDWLGNAGFVLPWRTEQRSKFFCSEACAAALRLDRPWTLHPQGLLIKETTYALEVHP